MKDASLSLAGVANSRTDDSVLRERANDPRDARVEPERLLDAALEVFELGGVLRRARALAALEQFVHFVEEQLLPGEEKMRRFLGHYTL